VRCSSSEAQLSAYIDGELGPVATARLGRHLESCAACTVFIAELRSIDALLLTAREPELAPNFSYKVMAEVRCLPLPQARRSRPFAVLGTYVVFAWAAIGAFLLFGGLAARAMLATISATFAHFARDGGALATTTGRLFGQHTFDVTAAMGALLALDLAVAAGFVALYSLQRGRRALAGPESW